MFRIVIYFIFIYLIYRGINYLFRIFAVINKNRENVSSSSTKSKFSDIEEAQYTEIKDDKDKESH
jgi:hypothetical protein